VTIAARGVSPTAVRRSNWQNKLRSLDQNAFLDAWIGPVISRAPAAWLLLIMMALSVLNFYRVQASLLFCSCTALMAKRRRQACKLDGARPLAGKSAATSGYQGPERDWAHLPHSAVEVNGLHCRPEGAGVYFFTLPPAPRWAPDTSA
jgi:hypothetical protein